MIAASQWYNIASATSVGSRTGIRVEFGQLYALMTVSVDYGNAVITAVESNITDTKIKVGARIRYNGGWWFDVKMFPGMEDAQLSASLYDNRGWSISGTNPAGSGSTVCIINDISSVMQPQGGGESLWERINVGTEEEPAWALIPKEYEGHTPGIITRSFITFGGTGTGGSGEGGTGGATALDGLTDVTIAAPKNGHILTYDALSGQWVNSDALGTLDATVAALARRLSNLESLWYLDSENEAVRTTLNVIIEKAITFGGAGNGATGEGGNGGATALDGLTDVTIAAPKNGQFLVYDSGSGQWVNSTQSWISEKFTELEGAFQTQQDNTAVLQGYFTDGVANNASRLGGQLPAYYATQSAVDEAIAAVSNTIGVHISNFNSFVEVFNSFQSETARRLSNLESLWYLDSENEAVRTTLNVIIEKAITFGGAGTSSGSSTGVTALSALEDVSLGKLTAGEALVWDGSKWVNQQVGASGDYLPLSGGTINGTTDNPLVVSTTDTTGSYIRMDAGGYARAAVGWSTDRGAFLYNWQHGASLAVGDDNKAYFGANDGNAYELLHSGNIGTYNNGYIWSSNISPFDYHLNGTYIYAGGAIANNWPKDWGILINNGNGTGGIKNQFYAATDGTLYWRIKYDDANRPWQELLHSGNLYNYGVRTIYDLNYLYPDDYGYRNTFLHGYQWHVSPVGATRGFIASMLDLTYSPDWRTQVMFQHSTYQPYITVRCRHSGTTWTGWYELIHSGNIGSYISGGGTPCLPLSGGAMTGNISYQGSMATSEIIRFLNNTSDANGNGIAIGGGGRTIIGGGESAELFETYGGVSNGETSARNELMIISNDGNVDVFTNCQNGVSSAIHYMFSSTNGELHINNKIAGTGTYFYANRLDTGYKVSFGIGSGGVNRGIYDQTYDRWLIHSKGDDFTYLTYNIKIEQSKFSNGLFLNRTEANSGAAIAIQTQGTTIGTIGISGSKTFEFAVFSGATSTIKMQCDANGNFVTIGSLTFGAASDRRLKDNIRRLTFRNTVEVLRKLRPVTFDWNSTAASLDSTKTGHSDGFLADEYEKLIPNSGRDIWTAYRAIDYTRAIPYLVSGWQIHNNRLQVHDTELEKVKRQLRKANRRIESMEKALKAHNITIAA